MKGLFEVVTGPQTAALYEDCCIVFRDDHKVFRLHSHNGGLMAGGENLDEPKLIEALAATGAKINGNWKTYRWSPLRK